jgi:hypothetical protein
MTTYIYYYGKHEILKTENPISYFSCFIFTNNERDWFSATAKGLVNCVDAPRALFFGIFCFCVCEFFYFPIRSEGADYATIHEVFKK